MVGRDTPKAGPSSLAEWKRYVQKETRRLLQKEQEQRRAQGDGVDLIDPVSGLALPPEAMAQQQPPPPPRPERSTRQYIPPPVPTASVVIESELADLDLDDLAALPTDVRPLTPVEFHTLQQTPERPSSSPLEAEELALAAAEVGHADFEAKQRTSYNNEENAFHVAQATTHVDPALTEEVLATRATMVEMAQESAPVRVNDVAPRSEPGTVPPDGVMVQELGQAASLKSRAIESEPLGLFDTAHMARREEDKPKKETSFRQKREDLIEDLLDPVISLEQAATILNVCKTTVRRYTNRGLLQCVRTPGNQRRFRLSTVLSFVEEKDVKGIGKRGRKPGRSKDGLDAMDDGGDGED